MAAPGSGGVGGELTAGGGGRQLAAAMPPPPPRAPKRKDVVLEEDEWTSTLEAIIERDYFPELGKLQSKLAWLEAIRSGDPEQIRQAQLLIAQQRAVRARGRPATGATPAGAPLFTPGGTAARAVAGDTPYIPVLPPGPPLHERRPATGGGYGGGGGEEDEGAAAGLVPAPPVSLDAFLSAHTSEDNASFQEILEKVNKKRRLTAAARLALAPQSDHKLLITDGRERTDGFGTTGQAPFALVTWRHDPKNALFYDGANRDALALSEAELAAQVQGPPKSINRGATRFPRELQPSASATPTASTGGGGASASGAAAAARPAAAVGVAGTRGYDILATPSFDPGAGGETPLMTWGDIEATPMRIEAEDLPPGPLTEGPSFFIKEGSRREQKGQELSSRAAASLRRRVAPRGSTPAVVGTIAAAAAARRAATGGTGAAAARRPGSGVRLPTGPGAKGPQLSEAARRLASSMHKGRQPDADLALRASYGAGGRPTPRRSAAATPAAGGGGWSGAGTPWGTPARGAATPAVAATLQEEELRVQALMKARQAEAERGRQLEAAREAARQALQGGAAPHAKRSHGPAPPPEALPPRPGGGAGGGDLTAGLLNL